MLVQTKYEIGQEVYLAIATDDAKSITISGPHKITDIVFEAQSVTKVEVTKLYFYKAEGVDRGRYEYCLYPSFNEALNAMRQSRLEKDLPV